MNGFAKGPDDSCVNPLNVSRTEKEVTTLRGEGIQEIYPPLGDLRSVQP